MIRLVRLVVTGLGVTIALAVLAASVVLQGPRLGHLIEGALPASAGKMKIGGVTWHLRALVDLVTDEPSPIAVDDLQIIDPEGTVVLDVPHLDAKVKLRSLIGGRFSIHALRVPKGNWRFAQLKHGDAIGFLAALGPKTPPPPPPPGTPPGPGSTFEIADAELGDLTALFDFPGVWGLELRHMHGHAALIQSTVDPKHPVFGFDAGSVVAEGGGWLRVMDNVLPFERVVINRIATAQDHPDDIQLELGEADTGRSRLGGHGSFTGIYGLAGPDDKPGIDLHLKFEKAGDALTAVAAGKGLPALAVGGDGAGITVDLTQPFERIKVAAAIRGLDVRYGDYRAQDLGLDLGFDGGAGRVDVTHFALGAPGGGHLKLDAHLDINRLVLEAALGFDGFHTESYLPPALRPLGAGQIDGKLEAKADLAKHAARLAGMDLRFARAQAGGLPRTVRIRGAADLSSDRVKTSGVTVSVAGADATARGSVDLDRQLVDLALGVAATDLARLLGDLGLPPLAKDARVDAQVNGRLDDPSATGNAVVHGLGAGDHVVRELAARFTLDHGLARLEHLSGPAFGGRIEARGTLRLWDKSARKPLATPVVEARLDARDLDLAALAPGSGVTGRVSVGAEAKGPLDALEAQVEIPAGTTVSAVGDSFSVGPVALALDGGTLAVRGLHVGHRGGGTLDVKGRVGLAHQDLDLNLVLARFPLATLPGVADAGVPVSGFVSAHLHVGGRPDRPQLGGTIDLADVVVRGVRLGKGELALAPTAVGRGHAPGVSVHGQLFDRFDVDVDAALSPKGPSVHGRVAFRRLELHTLAPELAALGDGRSVTSGRVAIDLEPGQPLALDVLLPELWLSIARAVDGPSGETTVQRVRIEAARPVHVHVEGDHVALDEAHFATDGGDLRVEGRLDGRAISGSLSGHLDLELLQPFLAASPVERLGGDLRAELRAAGTLDQPDLRGEVAIVNPIRLRARGFDREIAIDSGRFALNSGSGLSIENLALTVDGSTMRLGGRATLGAGFVPENLEADVDGDVSARLLAYAAPDAVSDAQGKAHVRAHLRGTLLNPDIRGRLDLDAIDFRLRDLGSEVRIESGIVEISNEGVILHNVKVLFDDQGQLVIGASGVRAGRVQFTNLFPFQPGDFDLPLHGERLTYRSPGTFEIDDLAFDLDLKGSLDRGFGLGGEVRLVSGRYLQAFQVQNLALRPRVDESTVRPFYDGKPLLEGLRLDLSVRTVGDGFVVQNNLAPEIHADIILHIGGTLGVPQLAGDIRPTDGRFNIPFMRGDFDLVPNVNHVTFIATKSIADGDTPDIQIEAVNLVTDANGVDHNVHMRINGPLREAQIDLSSDDGLDRNQTAFLLLTGRTSASNSSPFGTQNATVGANLTTGADIAGQATRDTVANLMEPYIDDTFQRLTGLNLRLTVGSDGFEGRLRKRVSRYGDLQFDYLQGFQNQSHWNGQANLWLVDYLSLGGGIEQIRLSSEQGVPETLPLNYNFELRLDYAIRR
ncbi:MAG TPA: translocation/assembly module TamB domain-containing protein [Polyangia bacterium]|nr:translocation/assembly module TamB domain-containing protein [Polyangia bacterium]